MNDVIKINFRNYNKNNDSMDFFFCDALSIKKANLVESGILVLVIVLQSRIMNWSEQSAALAEPTKWTLLMVLLYGGGGVF